MDHLELNDLSKIGFGTHNVSGKNKEHCKALAHALKMGCNLIDTSANYMQGESEQLIGDILSQQTMHAFVVSKPGYLESENLHALIAAVSGNLIHPDFLKNRLELSLQRLNGRLDAYLLQNPEFCFTQEKCPTQEEFYERIGVAFEFLEQQTAEGKIRYYGISSNTFHLSTGHSNTIQLSRVLEIARNISSNHHFKFIEFPLNLCETEALMKHNKGESILDLAQNNGLVTLSNRPLNAMTAEGALRLACNEGNESRQEEQRAEEDSECFNEVLECVRKRLLKQDDQSDPMEFLIIRNLSENWKRIGNPEGAETLFQDYFFPFLDQLYQGRIPKKDLQIFERFCEKVLEYAVRTRTERTHLFYRLLREKNETHRVDTRSFAVQAIDYCLQSGVDHVLTGMRNQGYVDEVKNLFRSSQYKMEAN